MNKLTSLLVEKVKSQKPVPAHVIDNLMVVATGREMSLKLKQKRDDGYGGWYLYKDCSKDFLLAKLNKHVKAGNMIDVMNLAAMIHIRHELYGDES